MSYRFPVRALLLLSCSALTASACTDSEDPVGPPTMDAAVPGDGSAQTPDATSNLDAAADASLDAALARDAGERCHAPLHEACILAEPRSVTLYDVTCSGATPVRCLGYGPAVDGAVPSTPPCVASVEVCESYPLPMKRSFECDDTNDCPRGQFCYLEVHPSFLSKSRCVPDCYVPPPKFMGSGGYLCKQDCECGTAAVCSQGSCEPK